MELRHALDASENDGLHVVEDVGVGGATEEREHALHASDEGCNSSKGDRDLVAWYASRDASPPLLLLRRYLKLAVAAAEAQGAMGLTIADAPPLAFDIRGVPIRFPPPTRLVLWTAAAP